MGRIPLRARDGSIRAYALVDDADFAWLNQWDWYLEKTYAARKEWATGKHHTIYLHRQILGLERGDPRMGEHENRDRLDYRRSNLRIAGQGHSDNQQNVGLRADNTSGYRGVTWHKLGRKWAARVKLNGKDHHLGLHDTAEMADAAAKAFRAKHMPFSEDAALIA